jgi:hypothetical protein
VENHASAFAGTHKIYSLETYCEEGKLAPLVGHRENRFGNTKWKTLLEHVKSPLDEQVRSTIFRNLV